MNDSTVIDNSAGRGKLPQRLRSWPVRLCVLAGLFGVLGLTARPAWVQYHLHQGCRALERSNAGAALDEFRAAERADPERAETQFWLARAARKTGDLEGVRRHLDRALQLSYEDPERLRREWWLLLAETGRIRDVEMYLPGMLMNSGQDDVEICDAFARGYCLNLEFDKALALLSAWESDHSDDFRPYVRQAEIYSGRQEWTQAEAACREALRRSPDNAQAHRELGRALVQLHRSDEARSHLQQALQHAQADTDALLLLARMLRDAKDYDAASAYVRRVLDHDPRNEPARQLLAEILLARGDPEGAIQEVQPLVGLWPEDLSSRYTLAQSLRAAGRLDEAEAQFRVYAECEPYRARIEVVSREVRRHPADAELRYELGLLLLKHESRAEGVAWLQSVFQYAPAHPGAHRALADYYAKVGQEEFARLHRQWLPGDQDKPVPEQLAGQPPRESSNP